MNKINKYIPSIILLDALIFITIFVITNIILSLWGLKLRQWVLIMSGIIMAISIVAGIIQLLFKIKSRALKIGVLSIFTMLVLALSPIGITGAAFVFAPEHVVERNGTKYVAYVNEWLHTYVYYYDYKNFMVAGATARIEEYYGKGGFDPIKNKYGYKYSVVRTAYYDEDGDLIAVFEEK